MKKRKIEEQLDEVEKCLANAEEYVSRDVNVESSSQFHMADWRGKSGHPLWMKNFAIPTMKRFRAKKERVLDTIHRRSKDRKLTNRKRNKNM